MANKKLLSPVLESHVAVFIDANTMRHSEILDTVKKRAQLCPAVLSIIDVVYKCPH